MVQLSLVMLDIKFIRDNADAVQQNAQAKGYTVDIAALLRLDGERRIIAQKADELRERRNANAATMKGGRPEQSVIDEGKQIKVELGEVEGALSNLEAEVLNLQKAVPNMAAADVPFGASDLPSVLRTRSEHLVHGVADGAMVSQCAKCREIVPQHSAALAHLWALAA